MNSRTANKAGYFGSGPRVAAFALFFGSAIPVLLLGRGLMAVFVVLALSCLISAASWRSFSGYISTVLRHPIGLAVILTFVLWLPNLLTSSDVLLSLQTVLRTLAFLAVFAVIRVANDFDDQVTKYLLRAFVVSSALMGAFALYTLFVGSELY